MSYWPTPEDMDSEDKSITSIKELPQGKAYLWVATSRRETKDKSYQFIHLMCPSEDDSDLFESRTVWSVASVDREIERETQLPIFLARKGTYDAKGGTGKGVAIQTVKVTERSRTIVNKIVDYWYSTEAEQWKGTIIKQPVKFGTPAVHIFVLILFAVHEVSLFVSMFHCSFIWLQVIPNIGVWEGQAEDLSDSELLMGEVPSKQLKRKLKDEGLTDVVNPKRVAL